jgi:hypothetical protein
MNNKSSTFCSAPWRSVYYQNSTNSYKVCCDYTSKSESTSPQEFFNSPEVNDIKRAMLNGEWHPGCKVCRDQEKAQDSSPRLDFNENYQIDEIENLNDFKLKWLDYRPGNLCNLKCRMCSSSSSSLIEKEIKQYPELLKYHNLNAEKPNTYNFKTLDNFKDLEVLKVLGGEPTIDPDIYDLLSWVIDNNLAKNINLRYTTNATNLNERWLELVREFKSTSIQVSLDGTGATYEYIRTPANWKSVKNNILQMQHKIPNLSRMGFNCVFSLWNCFTVDQWWPELYDVASQCYTKYRKPPRNVSFINCTWPESSQVSNLPDNFKQIMLDKIDGLENCNKKELLKNYTTMSANNNNADIIQDFFNYNDILDKIRKTDINTLSPIYEELRKQTKLS